MKKEYHFYVYFMASDSGTLYVGFTKSIKRRVYEHKSGLIDGFTKKYKCHKLVYYEHYTYVYDAMNREKEIKKWNRKKKEVLINALNPHWNDLYGDMF